MDQFHSTAEMIEHYCRSGWKKETLVCGFVLAPPESFASGQIKVYGDIFSHCLMDSDIILNRDVIERFYYRERGIQITFIDNMTGVYYQNKADVFSSNFGIFCHVNDVPRPWFHRYPAGTAQKGISIMLLESFFTRSNIPLPDDVWEVTAAAVNGRKISFPSLAALCVEMKKASVNDERFPLYLHAKCAEAASILISYAYSQKRTGLLRITPRSRQAALAALRILNTSFVHPPAVETLAQMAGVDKKTLQKAFLQITGQSVHDYIRSLRIEKAILLMERPLTIGEIAEQTGYYSKINFYKAFKETFGDTPNNIRYSLNEVK